MCLATPVRKPYVAKADIYCYKVLKENDNQLVTPFQEFPIKLGELYETSKVSGEISGHEIGGGFIHAFASPSYMYLKESDFTLGSGKFGMYLAVIPKGSQFFVNNGCGEICATAMKVISKIADIERESPYKENLEVQKLEWTESKTFNTLADSLTTMEDIVRYAKEHNLYSDILHKYEFFDEGSYEKDLYAYRLIVAVLTENEENSLTKGVCWYPFVQFLDGTRRSIRMDEVVIGTIESGGTTYKVVGGHAYGSSSAGLGYFASLGGVSYSWTNVGFRSVSSREIACFISKHFGKIVFNLMYGLSNCKYRWIEKGEAL